MLFDESLDGDADSSILLDAAQEVELPILMVATGDEADSSVSSLYNADFSGAAIVPNHDVSSICHIAPWTATGCTQSNLSASTIPQHAAAMYSAKKITVETATPQVWLSQDPDEAEVFL